MAKSLAWLIAGAVLVTAGAAHAQESANAVHEGDVPWFQRFSSSTGLTEALNNDADRQIQPTWSLSQRWGVTVDVREGQRVQVAGVDQNRRNDETSVGAYYQFTPRVRLGGEVSLSPAHEDTPVARDPKSEDTAAGVRIQSAFRF